MDFPRMGKVYRTADLERIPLLRKHQADDLSSTQRVAPGTTPGPAGTHEDTRVARLVQMGSPCNRPEATHCNDSLATDWLGVQQKSELDDSATFCCFNHGDDPVWSCSRLWLGHATCRLHLEVTGSWWLKRGRLNTGKALLSTWIVTSATNDHPQLMVFSLLGRDLFYCGCCYGIRGAISDRVFRIDQWLVHKHRGSQLFQCTLLMACMGELNLPASVRCVHGPWTQLPLTIWQLADQPLLELVYLAIIKHCTSTSTNALSRCASGWRAG